MRAFLQNNEAHHAQKDISEALEQYHGSKNLSEVYEQAQHNFWLSQKGVSGKDSKLKTQSKISKDSYHTRRSKQNSYYVTNKNIASSKIPMVVRRKRGCHSGASPSIVACYFLNIILGCLGHPQIQPFANPYSFIHRKITQNLKT